MEQNYLDFLHKKTHSKGVGKGESCLG